MKKTPYHSYASGKLPVGCQMCVKGQKLVLFATGHCPRKCFYCPLSDNRKDVDTIYANEWKLKDENEIDAIIKEAELTRAKGAGITGGDPLVKIDRTARYIKILKKRFGKKFHIHLYATMDLLTKENLDKLYNAGLDEIRIHPNFYIKKEWQKIYLIKKYDWDIGVEIPVIPKLEDKTKNLLDFFVPKIDFLNLNELEISDNNSQQLISMKYLPKNSLSYGIKGSQKMALDIIRRYEGKIPMHYCTTRLKDRVQLARRLKRRAKNASKKYDIVTEEGLLRRGAIYTKKLIPGFGYERKLESMKNKDAIIKSLVKIRNSIAKKYKIKDDMIEVDDRKLRILTSINLAKKINEKNLTCAIVTEYPTWDQLETELEFIKKKSM